MSARTVIGWAVAALVTVALAVWAVVEAPAPASVTVAGEPAFPALRANPQAAARITIRSSLGDFTLERGDGGAWVAKEKYGYPVDTTEVRKLIVTLSDLRLVERKTRRPERYPRIDVEDPGTKGSESRLVHVEAADGSVLAEAILGKERLRYTGGRENGVYLRRPGEDQAWLASGGMYVKRRLDDWMDKDVVNVAADDVAEVAIAPAGGTPAFAARRAKKGAPLVLDPAPPAGREADPDAIKRLASVLSFVRMKDVVPAATKPLPKDRTVARLTTFDGVEVVAETVKLDKSYWLTIRARFVGEGTPSKEAKARIAAIEKRTKGWVYEVAEYIHDRLAKPYDEYLKKRVGGS